MLNKTRFKEGSGASGKKKSACQCGDSRDEGLILGSGTSPRVGSGNSLQYSYLKNSMDRGVLQVTVHRVSKSWTELSH